MKLLLLATALLASQARAQEAPSASDYGLGDVVVSEKEKAADDRWGGYPNNAAFNNDKKCAVVVSMQDAPLGAKRDALEARFSSYALASLMVMDVTYSTIKQQEPLIRHIDLMAWKALPALYPLYCRTHRNDTLMDATSAVYSNARRTLGGL